MEQIPMFYDVATEEELKVMFGSSGLPYVADWQKEDAKKHPDSNLEQLATIYSIRGDEEKAAYYINQVSNPDIINDFYHYL